MCVYISLQQVPTNFFEGLPHSNLIIDSHDGDEGCVGTNSCLKNLGGRRGRGGEGEGKRKRRRGRGRDEDGKENDYKEISSSTSQTYIEVHNAIFLHRKIGNLESLVLHCTTRVQNTLVLLGTRKMGR